MNGFIALTLGSPVAAGMPLPLPMGKSVPPDNAPIPPTTTKSLRAKVWDEFIRLITADPDLSGLDVQFRSWGGAPDDDQVPAAVEELPWMRFSPSAGKSGPFAMGYRSTPIVVHVDQLTRGLDVESSMNLWTVIESLILSRPFQEAMRVAGAGSVIPREPAFGVKPSYPKFEPVLEGAIFAAGSIEIKIYVRSGGP